MTSARIIYTSMIENTEEIVDITAEAFEDLGLKVEIDERIQVDVADFGETDVCIVATYTYGDGDLSNKIIGFYEDLQEIDLSGKIFGVCGSGDMFYDDFCKSVDGLEAVFTQIRVKKGADNVKVDLAAEEDGTQRLEEFVKRLVTAAE